MSEEWMYLIGMILCIALPVWAMLHLDDDNAEM
jgi:hypothetical protein